MVKFAEYAIKLQTFWRWNDICASKKRMAKLAHKVILKRDYNVRPGNFKRRYKGTQGILVQVVPKVY